MKKKNNEKNQNICFIRLPICSTREILCGMFKVCLSDVDFTKVYKKKSMYQRETNSITVDLKQKTCKYSGNKLFNILTKFSF